MRREPDPESQLERLLGHRGNDSLFHSSFMVQCHEYKLVSINSVWALIAVRGAAVLQMTGHLLPQRVAHQCLEGTTCILSDSPFKLADHASHTPCTFQWQAGPEGRRCPHPSVDQQCRQNLQACPQLFQGRVSPQPAGSKDRKPRLCHRTRAVYALQRIQASHGRLCQVGQTPERA